MACQRGTDERIIISDLISPDSSQFAKIGILNLNALNVQGTAVKSEIQNLVFNLHVDVWLDGGWGVLTFFGTMSLLSAAPIQCRRIILSGSSLQCRWKSLSCHSDVGDIFATGLSCPPSDTCMCTDTCTCTVHSPYCTLHTTQCTVHNVLPLTQFACAYCACAQS